jgi:hypothetical protein
VTLMNWCAPSGRAGSDEPGARANVPWTEVRDRNSLTGVLRHRVIAPSMIAEGGSTQKEVAAWFYSDIYGC